MNRERRINDNSNAKIRDIKTVYNLSVKESNLATSAMLTILCDILIRKGIVTADEISTLLATEKIVQMQEYLREITREEKIK